MMNKISIFGSCRVYRPFLKKINGIEYSNIDEKIDVVFPKVGFFHSIKEIAQTLRFIKEGMKPEECKYVEYLFRKEPVDTTPGNVFNEDLWVGGPGLLNGCLEGVEAVVIEVSSLDYFYHKDSDLCFHWNPNKNISASYSDIYPDGYYKKFKDELSVEKKTCNEDDVVNSLREIKGYFPNIAVIVMGHINDHLSSNWTRKKLNALLELSCEDVEGVFYFDNKDVFDKYGYAINNGVKDIHHLSSDGEIALGKKLQSLIIDKL